MKFVKALNQGIVTDLGIGNKVYHITMEGCEVEDSIAAKLRDIFGHLIEVTDAADAPAPEAAPVVTEGQIPSEGATPVAPVVEETPVVTEEVPVVTTEETPVAPEVPTEVVPEATPEMAAEATTDDLDKTIETIITE